METKPLVLGYWAIQGRAEPLRQLLEYLHVPYVNKKYTDRQEWATDKATLNNPFPNLPYLVDGDKIITESQALAVYLIEKAGKSELLGRTPEQKVLAQVLSGVIDDITKDVKGLAYVPNWESEKGKYFADKVVPRLKRIEQFLTGKKFFLGDEIHYVDFNAYLLFNIIRALDNSIIEEHPNIKSFVKNYEDVPELKAYFASDRFQKSPILSNTSPLKI
eukprot:TRINITY_DN5354_c0_g1_i1.p1 TRINITY_DN5354_c0_g1~~TRINITY_DN5354_c0_g1_i1.p1  ORF type:complete len:218 (+),score=23.93 TRINITY_DN5354_c0_g1_i1:111-764(+)